MCERKALQKNFNIVSIGDFVVDIVVGIPRFPVKPAAHQLAQQIGLEPGGAGNFLIAGAHLGLNMTALGVVGDDEFGNSMVNILAEKGIDTRGVVCQEDGSTTTIIVLTDESGNHVFIGKYGAGPDVHLTDTWRASLRAADAVQAWGYTLREERLTQTMLDSLAYAREQGRLVFFDPGPQSADARPEHRQFALENSDVILLTEDEIPHLLPGAHGIEFAPRLLEHGPSIVCVKRGPNGCSIFTKDEIAEHPGFPVEVRDTSAAGDSFDAAFIYAHLHGWPLPQVAAFANAMGAAKVRKFGTGRQVPTADEVRQVLEKFEMRLPF